MSSTKEIEIVAEEDANLLKTLWDYTDGGVNMIITHDSIEDELNLAVFNENLAKTSCTEETALIEESTRNHPESIEDKDICGKKEEVNVEPIDEDVAIIYEGPSLSTKEAKAEKENELEITFARIAAKYDSIDGRIVKRDDWPPTRPPTRFEDMLDYWG